MLSRRGFFGALAALTVAPRLRSLFPVCPPPVGLAAVVAGLPPPGTAVAGINRATFTFWRNQTPSRALDLLARKMERIQADERAFLNQQLYGDAARG